MQFLFWLFAPIVLFASHLFDQEQCLPPSMHHVIGISKFDSSIELEDGSIWRISPSETYKTLDWFLHDEITITQNRAWISMYHYRIVNEQTGDSLVANLFLGPHTHGQYTFYITGIDRIFGELILTNGFGEKLGWQISSLDLYTFQHWALHDAVIIGENSDFDANCDALLINVHLNNWIRASQVGV
ncbi:MAG TPA: hypothetical protein VLE95_07310 [Chlamydiales bacterium]|nr:hypothetical protein [Chlamydiales bacterium]